MGLKVLAKEKGGAEEHSRDAGLCREEGLLDGRMNSI